MHGSTKIQYLLPFLRPYKMQIIRIVGLTIVLSVLAMLPPLLVRSMIDRVLTQGQHGLLLPITVALLSVPILIAGCGYLQMLGITYIGQRFVFDIRNALYCHLLTMSLRFYTKRSSGMLVNRLMGDSGIIQQVLTGQSIAVVSDLVCATFAICATLLISWRLALVMLLIMTVFVINYRVNIVRISSATRSYQSAYDRLSGGIQNRLNGSVAVKTFGTEEREHAAFQHALYSNLGMVQEAMTSSNRFTMNTQLIHQSGHSILYFLGCALILRAEITYGEVVAFTAYAVQLLMPAVRFSQIAKQFQEVGIAMERLAELFRETPEIDDAPDAVAIERLRGAVHFDNVQFWYEPGKPVLKAFSLRVEPGMTVALIGPTGCGKSTVLSLILRYYEACEGRLTLDGIDIRRIALASLRNQFGIVLQEPLLFSVSIAENIRYGRRGASLDQIIAAAKVAEIHEFVMALPEAYDTLIGADGLELSVGQRQRITIARAVLADPAILIMDEATSALDSDSERAIQRAMAKVLHNRTSFIVAHRLSTIKNADCIVLLHDGQIAEAGTHRDLMALPGGRYHDLYNKHMGKEFIEE